MVPNIDLYMVLRNLLDQIPDGMVSTPYYLSVALGDPDLAHTLSHILKREGLREALHKVVAKPTDEAKVFRDFSSKKPLKELAELQRSMSKRVILEDAFDSVDRYAGVDAAYRVDEANAVCVVTNCDLRILESASTVSLVHFPYIPGYLMFREAPVFEAAAKRVSRYDVLLVNGHGIAHPRGCGLATCVGLELDVPVIGVAKRRLIGIVGESRNGWAPLIHDRRVVGAELRMKVRPPIYVSVGHRISLETSVKIVLKTILKGGLPEPLRRAHVEARRGLI